MTNEEALIQLRLGPGINEDVSEEYNEAVNMAIEALKSQPSEDEKIIRISKGTLKARTGKYVIYDVEWLKEHFNTTEAKIYGQTNKDCISREAVLDALHRYFADGFDSDKWWNSTHVLDAINKAPSVNPQPKEEPQQKTGHWTHDGGYWKNRWICSECGYKLYAEQSRFCPDCGSYNGGARGDIPLQQSVPKMPQPSERTETGRWIEHKHGGIEHIECSECGVWFLKADLPRKSYCPNCGSCNGDMIKNIMRDITNNNGGKNEHI